MRRFILNFKAAGSTLVQGDGILLILKILYIDVHIDQGSSTFSVRGPIYIFHINMRAAVIADYKIIMTILNIIIGAWAARQVT